MSNESVREMWGDRFGRPDPKIVCVGLNYGAHAGESGGERRRRPLLFGKFANTLLWDGDPIVLQPGYRARRRRGGARARDRGAREPRAGGERDGRDRGLHVRQRRERARHAVRRRPVVPGQGPRRLLPDRAGARRRRRLRHRERPRPAAAERRGAAGRAHERPDLHDPGARQLHLELRSRSSRGDIILTGTPEGVGVFRDPKIALADGDVVEIEIEGIGVLRNEVRA